MTEKYDPAEDKLEIISNEEWDFKLDTEGKDKYLTDEDAEGKTTKKKKSLRVEGYERKLELDMRPLKAKPQVYKATSVEPLPEERAIIYGSVLKRFFAEIIDLFIMIIIYVLSTFFVPFGLKLCQIFNERAKLKFMYDAATNSLLVHLGIFAFDFFIVFVLFLALSGTSVGKKVMGLYVRNKYNHTISLPQAFLREMIYKPLSALSIVGVLYALINDEKKTLHDLLASTIVVSKK
jgi:uncharacterized RDD family membrane protein YckC